MLTSVRTTAQGHRSALEVHFTLSEVTRAVFICALSTLLLFWDFYANGFGVADHQWFNNHQRDMESHVVGRMVKSRQDGFFSAGGFLGLGALNDVPPTWSRQSFDDQYLAFTDDHTFGGTYRPYKSLTGGQGLLFGVLDYVIPIASGTKLDLFHMVASLLSALTLAAVALWFFQEFGTCVGVFALASILFSQWLVVFGRNLYWSLWSFYLPMLAVMYLFRNDRSFERRHLIKFSPLVFVCVSVKLLSSGFEYVTTALVMMMVPISYYFLLDGSDIRKFVKAAFTIVISSSLAVVFAFGILCLQIASLEGRPRAGVDYVIDAFKRRTYPAPEQFGKERGGRLESRPHPIRVVLKFVIGENRGGARGTFFDLNNYLTIPSWTVSEFLFKVRYLYLLILFLLVSIVILWRSRGFSGACRRKNIALISTTWVSIAAPLSWFYIFNQHSYRHTHMNFIVWQMPFTIFGFALCGLAVRRIWDARPAQKVSEIL